NRRDRRGGRHGKPGFCCALIWRCRSLLDFCVRVSRPAGFRCCGVPMESDGLRRMLTVTVRVQEMGDEQVVVKTEREGMFWQPWVDTDDPKPTSPSGITTPPGFQKQTTKWKRDRRRLPEYSRKSSDPKYSSDTNSDPPTPTTPTPEVNGGTGPGDTPLDMSVRHRGLPPSYAQTVNSPGYRSTYRPSVITAQQNGGSNGRDELPQGMSMCDPIIEEHFRRSLGSAYHAVFQKESPPPPAPKSPPKPPTPVTPTSVIQLMDSEGLSVDDHFAKALGDTWKKLNRKDPAEIKGGNVVSI
ncbi:unnamed protein product, partial [Acanthoscelides obtectus]